MIMIDYDHMPYLPWEFYLFQLYLYRWPIKTSSKVSTYLACIYTISKGIVDRNVNKTHFIKSLNLTQLANWLEHYAEVLELNVWTSSTTTSVKQDPNTNKWHITVKRGQDGIERKFIVNHLIFATGLGGPKTPIYPGMVSFAINEKIYKMIRHWTWTMVIGKL